VTLIAVSKTRPAEVVAAAIANGQRHFGENRVEEALPKMEALRDALTAESAPIWHMIGHVQSRKARDVAVHFAYVHSLDSLKLAERYARAAAERTAPGILRVLLEINISGEASKAGFAAAGWQARREVRQTLWADVQRVIELPGVQIAGLMTMAPVVEDAEQTRPVFAALRALRDALAADFPQADWSALSMGMSDDYAVAIEEGATMVRLGRALFDRTYEA
jgi:hypothetical protein